jgi:uncharacterized membrane protein
MTSVSTANTSIAPEILLEKPRIASIDIMRGIVMVIMALDHTRDYFHSEVALFDPTDLTKTNPTLFFTRIITHYCAPTFVFLSGVSAYVSKQRKTTAELSLFLLTRGLWLVFLEFTVVRFALVFNLYYDFVIFQVIWVIGASMIILAALVYFNQKVILAIGLVLVFGHNIFDFMPLKPEDNGYGLWAIIRQAGSISFASGNFTSVAYPLIPWLGIHLSGYGIGFLYDRNFDQGKRKEILFYAGLAIIALFILVRYSNLYGDPNKWSLQKNGIFTLMSFVNVTKYPVSLLYALMTIGPVLILLSWMENLKKGALDAFRIIGRVPLFYYILHFFLIHFSALCTYLITTGQSWSDLDFHFSKGFGGIPAGAGYTLGWVYVAWISIVIVLYPACYWYHQYKSRHKHWWLSYL